MLRLLFILIVSLSCLANILKIENDEVFKAMLNESQNPDTNMALYFAGQDYRLDLTMIDLYDKVDQVVNKVQFHQYIDQVQDAKGENEIYFSKWFKKVQQLAKIDNELKEQLNKNLYIQLYSKNAVALLPEYKYIDFNRVKDMGLLRRIKRYNDFMQDSESKGLSAAIRTQKFSHFSKNFFTVEKLKEITEKDLKKIKDTYYEIYSKLVQEQFNQENTDSSKYLAQRFKYKNFGLKSKDEKSAKYQHGMNMYTNGVKVFNHINQLQHKVALLAYINDDIKIPRVSGHLIMTPIFIEKNWDIVSTALKEYTFDQFSNLEDDVYLFSIKKWIKKNKDKLKSKLPNLKKRKIKNIDIINQYEALTHAYPKKPWIKDAPDLVNQKGRRIYFCENFLAKTKRKFLNLAKNFIKPENYISLIAGTAVMIAAAGNGTLALSTRSLVKKAIETKKYEREFKEFLKSAPNDLLNALLFGSGFTPGRLYSILAMGSAKGALQSMLTGQDIKTGALVGTGFSLLDYYVLPYSLAKPMVSGADKQALTTNALLEITAHTVKTSTQGALVAYLTHEDPLKGALKGAAFGSISSAISIWFFGARFHPFTDMSDEEIDALIDAENRFQNDVGRGEYNITRQTWLDENQRKGGWGPNAWGASSSIPGNNIYSDNGYRNPFTRSHEHSHSYQKIQSGVFGFYLLRYLPTILKTGYEGHPDENFLIRFRSLYNI